MIKLENYEVVGWEHAIRGMRNPKNSWDRSDSTYCGDHDTCDDCPANNVGYCSAYKGDRPGDPIIIGENDHKLMMKLAKGGSVHAKYRRMITVYVDITAPLYWWKEFDTYKVGTVANSCSTMHKIADKEFTLDDFSYERLMDIGDSRCVVNYPNDEGGVDDWGPLDILCLTIKSLNKSREKYNETKVKPIKEESKRKELLKLYFDQMIQLLPSSYNQKRTIQLNYEVLANIYRWRKDHKLDEWREFCEWIEKLPYSEIITGSSLSDLPICNEIMDEAKKRVKDEQSPYHPTREDVTGGMNDV